MKTGIIGAGKVGITLGMYFKEFQLSGKNPDFALEVTGFFSRNPESAGEASEFTNTVCYESAEELVKNNDIIFLTVPDAMIKKVWEQIKNFSIEGKIICHCSGLLSSDIFEGIQARNACGYSIHPLFAVSSKWESHREIKKAYFSLEGEPEYLDFFKEQFGMLGNPVCILKKEQKVKYHAAAVFASNHVIALVKTAEELLKGCGFTPEAASQALMPLFFHNCRAVLEKGAKDALTGPVERADLGTIQNHITELSKEDQELYRLLSRKLLMAAKEKNPDRDYEELEHFLM